MTNGNMELAKDWYDRGKEDGIKALVEEIKKTDDYEFAMFSLSFIEEKAEKLIGGNNG